MKSCLKYKHQRRKKVALQSAITKQEISSFCQTNFLHLTVPGLPTIIVRTSLLRRLNEPGKLRGLSEPQAVKDGAKIYLCYRRCCFLTWKGRCCLLHRLSSRKSRFQGHPSE